MFNLVSGTNGTRSTEWHEKCKCRPSSSVCKNEQRWNDNKFKCECKELRKGITSAKNENKHKCSSCTLYIVLFSIFFTINVGIGSYFLYFHWYLKKDAIRVNNLMNL